MTEAELRAAEAALLDGGVGLLPTDTVYGLVAALDSEPGIAALYALKGRPRNQACQVLIYSAEARAAALAPLDELTRRAAQALLPGPATCIVADPSGRFGAAAGDEVGGVGIRAPRMPSVFAALAAPLVATSANEPGEPPACRVEDVGERLRAGCAVVCDIGPLPGVASAVVDLRSVAAEGAARLLRPGPDPDAVARALAAVGIALDPPAAL